MGNGTKDELPAGMRLIEDEDGAATVLISKDTGITIDSFSNLPGADVRYLDAKKKHAVVYVPTRTPESVARAKEISDILSKVVGRLRSGEIAGAPAKEVRELILWMIKDNERQVEASHREVFSMVAATAKIQTDARRKGARKKIENDPVAAAKATAKKNALALWQERAAAKHPKLRTVEQFATEVLRRWPVLESSKTICGWSAKWTKQVKAGKTPTC